jgi:hypothetical protein
MMTGAIWIIQRVHYPYLHFVDDANWVQAHRFHTRAITPIVMILMSLELISGIILWWFSPMHWASITQVILVLAPWGITTVISVPLHNQLQQAKSDADIQRLIQTNWIRTSAWTLRSALLLFMLMGFSG